MRSEFLRRLVAAVDAWVVPPMHLSLFGSAARADGDAASDIDVFVIRPRAVAAEDERWRAQLDDLAVQIRRWTGNHSGLMEVGEQELPRLGRSRRNTVADLRTQAVTLVGPSAADLLRSR